MLKLGQIIQNVFESGGLGVTASHYLEYNEQDRGVEGGNVTFSENSEAFEKELYRSNFCGGRYLHLKPDPLVGEDVYMPMDCGKFWCEKCGGLRGVIHNRRFSKVLSRVNLKNPVGQFVFTTPENLRYELQSRAAVGRFFRVVQGVIERTFGLNVRAVFYLHLFGDAQPGKYHPHWNVHILFNKKDRYKIPAETLAYVKKTYTYAMSKAFPGYLSSGDSLDVHYEYKKGAGYVLHGLKYMTKPVPIDILQKIDNELAEFIVLEMKGYQFVKWSREMRKEKKFERDNAGVDDCINYEKIKEEGLISPWSGIQLYVVDTISEEEFRRRAAGRIISCAAGGLYKLSDRQGG